MVKAFKKTCLIGSIVLTVVLMLSISNLSQAQEIKTTSESLVTRIAPGEVLPISIKLLNFGLNKRADVVISYQILNQAGLEVYSQKETVAVETTASFVKNIQIPSDLVAGKYKAVSSIVYEHQEAPAISSFEFVVEPKIFSFFRKDFFLYLSSVVLIILLVIFVSRWFFSNRLHGRFVLHDYSDKPHEERIFYEIISDTISQMRLHVGDDALKLAKEIPDLKVDSDTGKVISISGDPAKSVSLLVLRYETLLGRKVNVNRRDSKEISKSP